MIHRKKHWDYRTSKIVESSQALAMAICLIICLFYDLVRALMDDVACEFACAVRMRRNN